MRGTSHLVILFFTVDNMGYTKYCTTEYWPEQDGLQVSALYSPERTSQKCRNILLNNNEPIVLLILLFSFIFFLLFRSGLSLNVWRWISTHHNISGKSLKIDFPTVGSSDILVPLEGLMIRDVKTDDQLLLLFSRYD